jgi:RNA polymerase sigma factor (TIGR02999 family)
VDDNIDQSPDDLEALFPLLYRELRNRAGRLVHREAGNQSIQATALVHEAYLKLVRNNPGAFRNREHFVAIARRIMRQVLVDRARAKLTLKRGQKPVFEELPGLALAVVSTDPQMVIALNEALERFQALDARRARIVDLKFVARLSNEEIAETLGISISTVKQDQALAMAWLHRELT